MNNTKEFEQLYAGSESVSARTEAVAEFPRERVADKIALLQIPTMEEQVESELGNVDVSPR